MAEAAVRAFVSWEISWESVDVAMQVRDMLEKCELEVKEMLEGDEEGEREAEEEEEGTVEVELGGRVMEVVESESESDGEERSSVIARVGVARINDDSDEEEEEEH
jgi:hypothetical protein